MTTYNTYQEAKIANPESNIYIQAGEFLPEKSIRPSPWTYDFRGLALCNPTNHCMTVEEFLADGHKFIKGDVALIHNGDVKVVENPNLDWNIPDSRDNERYILRAAALEGELNLESAIKSVANEQFSEIIKMTPIDSKPRTKVECVPCHFADAWEPVKAYCNGDELFDGDKNKVACPEVALNLWIHGDLYERIETPMTERDELFEALQSVWIFDGVDGKEQLEKIVDSGLFKLVN